MRRGVGGSVALAALALALLVGPVWAGQDVCAEPNDAAAGACPIGGNSSATGFLDSPADVDRYRIEVGEGQTVQASLGTLPGDYALRLEAGDGTVVAEGAGGGLGERALGTGPLSGGTYYLVVSSNGDSSADEPYTLRVSVQGATAAPALTIDPSAPPPAPAPDRPLDQLVLNLEEAGDRAKASGKPQQGSDSRASWYEVTYKRDSSTARYGPQVTINRVYRAKDVATAQQLFQEQAGAGLPEAKETNPNYKSLGPQPMDPIGEEGSAVGAGQDFEKDVVVRHYRIVFRMGTLVETLYTYGPDTGNNFNVAYGIAKVIEKRILTPPDGPPPEVFSSRAAAEIGLGIGDAGKEATEAFNRSGSDERGSWYEARFERGAQAIGQRLGPNILYNKVFVANSNENARLIFRENAVQDLPEATEKRGPVFIEDKTRVFGNESFAVGACNDDCGGAGTDRLHERLVYRWGNVVVILYIWGRTDVSNPDEISTFAAVVAGRVR